MRKPILFLLCLSLMILSCRKGKESMEIPIIPVDSLPNTPVDSVPVIDSIYEGNISVFSQANIDSLPKLLEGKTIINGDVTVRNGTDINHFSSFKNITKITASLKIVDCPMLNSLEGFEQLEEVNHLQLERLPALEGDDLAVFSDLHIHESLGLINLTVREIPEFKKVIDITERLNVSNNRNLTNLSFLKNLRSVGSLFGLGGCAALESFEGLENLERVGHLSMSYLSGIEDDDFELLADINISNSLSMRHLDRVEEIPVFKNLIHLDGGLELGFLSRLKNVKFLENLISVDGELTIYRSDSIKNLEGLHNLESVNEFDVWLNKGLVNFGDIPFQLKNAHTIKVQFNPYLQSIGQLDSLVQIEDMLRIHDNSSLSSLIGFRNVCSQIRAVHIAKNGSLEEFCPLKNLLVCNRPDTLGVSIYQNKVDMSVNEIISNCN
ncbi:MAG: hypothetical protein AAFV95_02870 [Bacteroidota bacterium]